MRTKKSGKQQFMSGLLQFLWAELKTMNMTKLKSLYKIVVGYISMKYFAPKKIEARKPSRDIETSYRVNH